MPYILTSTTQTPPGVSSWSDPSVIAGATSGVILRPSGDADPSAGIYTTWATAHAAAVALTAPLRTIWIDSPGVTVSVPAGTYNMNRIELRSFIRVTEAALAQVQTKVQTAVGAVFTNFGYGAYDLWIDHLGTAALCTYTLTGANAIAILLGERTIYESSGNAAPVFAVAGTGFLIATVGDGVSIVGDGGTDYEVFGVTGTATLQLNFLNQTTLTATALRSIGGTTINVEFKGVCSFNFTQTAAVGTLAFFSGASQLYYAVGTPGDWVDADPTDVKTALDRIAAVVATLNAGPIP